MLPYSRESSIFSYSFGPQINMGYISSFWYYGSSMYNYNFINTNHFGYSYLYNKGTLDCSSYECKETDNHGTVNINSNKENDLGEFRIKGDGVLNLNSLNIDFKSILHPDIKSYLEKAHNGTITYDEECLTLKGKFHFDMQEAKKSLPHLFGKYTKTNNWFGNRVSSSSKKNGSVKYWENRLIGSKYPLKNAISDIFKYRLLNNIFGPDIAPKAKFNSFSKTVVFREAINKNLDDTSHTKKFKTALPKYLIEKIISDTRDVLLTSMNELLQKIDKNEHVNDNQYWFVQKITSLFYSSADPYAEISKGITKDNLIKNLIEVTDLLSENNFEKCCQVKDAICKNVTENGSKFTKEQIDDEIIPQIDEAISQIIENVAALKDFVNKLELQDQTNTESKPSNDEPISIVDQSYSDTLDLKKAVACSLTLK